MKISIRVPEKNLASTINAYNEWHDTREAASLAVGYNNNQYLTMEKGVLTYEGERNPFIQDLAIVVFSVAVHGGSFYRKPANLKFREQIWCGGAPEIEVLEYKTSERVLQWWETAKSKLETLCNDQVKTLEERVFILKNTPPYIAAEVTSSQFGPELTFGKTQTEKAAILAAISTGLLSITFSKPGGCIELG